ncbi:MAG: transglutaminase domain-containing protein [Oscillospiraceae bacterium]|nr:transglutaminase domain-containing protein [Oscillospiraceae bacterium]
MIRDRHIGLLRLSVFFFVMAFLLFSVSCAGGGDPPVKREDPGTRYEVPEFLPVTFDRNKAYSGAGVKIDASHTGEGYVRASCVRDKRLKFQIIKGDIKYTYDIPNDGTVTVFPIQSGDGSYSLRVMKNVTDNKYAELYKVNIYVSLIDEFQPFLHASRYVDYDRDSLCVEKAGELARESYDELHFIANVYSFICKQVKYDRPKAQDIPTGYLPDPDETMTSGMGICFDYASLAARMLRSHGIPTKVIFGYVSPNDVYHAWNMIYTRETGWITVGFEVGRDDWSRMDLTFSANGSDAKFIGNGENYSDVFEY